MQEDIDFEKFKQLWLDSLGKRTCKNAAGIEKWIATNYLEILAWFTFNKTQTGIVVVTT